MEFTVQLPSCWYVACIVSNLRFTWFRFGFFFLFFFWLCFSLQMHVRIQLNSLFTIYMVVVWDFNFTLHFFCLKHNRSDFLRSFSLSFHVPAVFDVQTVCRLWSIFIKMKRKIKISFNGSVFTSPPSNVLISPISVSQIV